MWLCLGTVLESVFGPEALLEAEINWPAVDVLLNKAAYDAPPLRRLPKKLREMWAALDDSKKQAAPHDLPRLLFNLQAETDALPEARMKHYTSSFVAEEFPGSTVSFQKKHKGVQLGLIASVSLPGMKTVRLFVKTHTEGSLLSYKSAASLKVVPASELLTYRVLDRLKLGCISYVYGRDEMNCYIATCDASMDGIFYEFEAFLKDSELAIELMGSACNTAIVSNSPAERIKEVAQKEPARSFFSSMLILQLLEILMGLSDLTGNETNFGFVKAGNTYKLRVLDFRVEQPVLRRTALAMRLVFEAATVGSFADQYRSYCVERRAMSAKLKDAHELLQGDGALSNFREAVLAAAEDVRGSLGSLPQKNRADNTRLLTELQTATENILANFTVLEAFLLEAGPKEDS